MDGLPIMASRETLYCEIERLRSLVVRPVSLRKLLALQPMEESILRELLFRHPIVVRRSELFQAVTGRANCASNAPDVHISRMREKLAKHGLEIKTRHGVGWSLPEDTAVRLYRMVGVAG
jgi:DNA-binding response OmpR family regulator